VFKAEEFAGLNFSDKVNACLEAVESNGGGACDARGLDGTQSVSTSIVVGDGAHGTTLLLPTGEIEFAVGTRLIYRSWATITGMGDGERGTVIICHATEGVGCVQSFDEASHQLQFPHLSEFRVKMTGPAVSGSIGLAIGGKENADVLSGKFEDIFSSGFDVGVEAGGAWGCTCYNRFDHVGGTGKSYGVLTRNFSHYGGDFNSNTWTGGWAWGDTGLADEVGGGNRWIGVDIENSHGHGFILGGAKTIVINPYEEGTGPDLLNGSNNMVIASWPWTPSQDSKCVTCSWMTGTSALTAESYYPSIAHDLVLSYDMIPRASGYTVYDQSGNGYNADLGYRGAGYWRVWTRNGLWDDGGWKSTTPAIPARIPVGSAPRTLVVWFSTTNTKTSEIGGWGTNGPLKKFAIRITEGRVGLDDYSGPPVPGPAVNVADGKWHMVVATYDGNSVSLTVDGSASSSTPRREDTDASAVTSSGDPGGAGFTGQMGYLGIYAVALNPTEIRALYQDFIAKRGISPINSDPAEPTSSIGRVVPHSTNAGGAVTDLHAATETTITFADHGFGNAAFCVASANVSLSLAPAVAQISLREVTFRFPPLTGSLYYNCTGN
jgi:hypothetical protein